MQPDPAALDMLREQLEQAERHHAAAVASLRAELEHERNRADRIESAAIAREARLHGQAEALIAALTARREPWGWRGLIARILPEKSRK